MLTASGKAKGRRLQQRIVTGLRVIGHLFGLKDDDITSRPMSCDGSDVVLSPAAQNLFPFHIECKNRETLNVTTTFFDYQNKLMTEPFYNSKHVLLLVHSRNATEPLVTMQWKDFWSLLLKLKELEQDDKASEKEAAKELPRTPEETVQSVELKIPKGILYRSFLLPEGCTVIRVNSVAQS
jgi:hypothetical protein